MWSCRKMGVVRGRTGEEWEGKGCGCDHGGCIGRSDGDGVMAMVSWQWCHGNGVMAMVSWQWCHGNGVMVMAMTLDYEAIHWRAQ